MGHPRHDRHIAWLWRRTTDSALLNALADTKHIDDHITVILEAALREFATVVQAPPMLAAA